jgi:hypothetical protein
VGAPAFQTGITLDFVQFTFHLIKFSPQFLTLFTVLGKVIRYCEINEEDAISDNPHTPPQWMWRWHGSGESDRHQQDSRAEPKNP